MLHKFIILIMFEFVASLAFVFNWITPLFKGNFIFFWQVRLTSGWCITSGKCFDVCQIVFIECGLLMKHFEMFLKEFSVMIDVLQTQFTGVDDGPLSLLQLLKVLILSMF